MTSDGIKSKMPRISVVTITRNSREFLQDTISSVLEQTYDNFEYIVVDGGSTDGTTDIIRANVSGIRKWISEPDEGIADAFNKGLALATGDYILFLNSDDALANSGVLKAVAMEIAGNDQPALVYGNYDILNRETGELVSHGCVNFAPKKLIYGQVLPHPCLFANRSYFEKYGQFDKSFKIAMDYEWMLRGILGERIMHLPMLITCIRDGGISTLDRVTATTEIIRALKKNGYFPGKFYEYKARGNFFMRAFLRKMLAYMRLYRTFEWLRNKFKSVVHNSRNASN